MTVDERIPVGTDEQIANEADVVLTFKPDWVECISEDVCRAVEDAGAEVKVFIPKDIALMLAKDIMGITDD